MRVVDLKALVKERGLQRYFHLRKAALIEFIRDSERQTTNSLQLQRQVQTQIQRQPQRLTQPNQTQSVRFRPDPPRQLELMRRLEGIPVQPSLRPTPRQAPPKRDVEFKPYQLRTKKKQERKEITGSNPQREGKGKET